MTTSTFTRGPTGKFQLGDAIEASRGLVKGTKRYGVFLVALLLGAGWLASSVLVSERTGALLMAPFLNGMLSGVFGLLYANFGLTRAAGQPLSLAALFRFGDRLLPLIVPAIAYDILATYVGLLWVAPFLMIVQAVIYAEAEGLQQKYAP